MSRLEIVAASGDEHLDEAARIWAEATAARDGDPDVAPLEAARPLIESVLMASPDALFLIALADHREAVGFALSAQVGTGQDRRAELRYLGVRPAAWGGGVAARLLTVLADHLRARGFAEAELWVNEDNQRAIDLYRRTAWKPSPEVRAGARSGRLMRRYVLRLGASAGSGR